MCQECRSEEDFLEEESMIPGLPDFTMLGKQAADAKKQMEENHTRQIKVLEEIRDGIRELIKVLKEGE